jgi:resuscitation-promoting factor RpfB
VTALLLGVVGGGALARSGSSPQRPTLRSAAMAASVDADRLARDRASRSAFRVEPAPPETVTVTHDGVTSETTTAAATVGDLLAKLAIPLDGDDEVSPPLDAAPGRSVTVVRVDVSQVTEQRPLAVTEQRRDDAALPRGETRVEDDGAPGVERVVFSVTRRDGRVTGRRQISSQVVTPAKPRVVVVGRGGGRTVPAGLNQDVPFKLRVAAGEAAAAEPPALVGGSQEGGASWYHYKPGTCAHRTLPKGTVVKVTNLATGQTATCTVADRGPFVAGRIIDLDRSVFMAIASGNQGVVRVRIEW